MAMSGRFGLRAAQAFRQPFRFTQRRAYSSATESAASAEAPKNESAFTKLWNSPVGPKTVHFWAPIMKWGLVLAGASDFTRPADQLSLSQNAALMATGGIWTRWCFVIKPRNVFLASVNFLVFCVGSTQVARILMHQQEMKGESLSDSASKAAKEAKDTAGKIIDDPKSIKDVVAGGK